MTLPPGWMWLQKKAALPLPRQPTTWPSVLYHAGSGRIFLVFSQDPSHLDESFIPYMRYGPPCTATRPISFAYSHLLYFRLSHPNRAACGCIIGSFPYGLLSTTCVMTLAQYCGFYYF